MGYHGCYDGKKHRGEERNWLRLLKERDDLRTQLEEAQERGNRAFDLLRELSDIPERELPGWMFEDTDDGDGSVDPALMKRVEVVLSGDNLNDTEWVRVRRDRLPELSISFNGTYEEFVSHLTTPTEGQSNEEGEGSSLG